MRRKSMTQDEIRARVTIADDGCWIWRGAVSISRTYAYPVFGARSVRPMVFEAFIGPWEFDDSPAFGMSCKKPDCINPEHFDFTGKFGPRAAALAAKRSQTHCKRGHEFEVMGFYRNTAGGRVCKACHRERIRCRRAKPISSASV